MCTKQTNLSSEQLRIINNWKQESIENLGQHFYKINQQGNQIRVSAYEISDLTEYKNHWSEMTKIALHLGIHEKGIHNNQITFRPYLEICNENDKTFTLIPMEISTADKPSSVETFPINGGFTDTYYKEKVNRAWMSDDFTPTAGIFYSHNKDDKKCYRAENYIHREVIAKLKSEGFPSRIDFYLGLDRGKPKELTNFVVVLRFVYPTRELFTQYSSPCPSTC
ncbi:MAG: hypothetical protein AAF611_10600 [Bacteroidota bacterium]